MQDLEAPLAVLSAWNLVNARLAPLGGGLINRTWRVTVPGADYVLQQVNPLFSPASNGDIQAVSAHLRARGLLSPELLPTAQGGLWLKNGGRVFRLMTCLQGVSRDRLTEPGEAREAGALLGRFHRALADLDHTFSHARAGVHDTPAHLATLRHALNDRSDHPDFGPIQALGEEIIQLAAALPPLPLVPPRIVHGDPKINNLLFDPVTGRALALIDLDTLGWMPLPLELGDAFRSWCNPVGEDHPQSEFSLPLFTAAVRGYGESAAGWITRAESSAIVSGTLTVYVELAARFCAVALRESYFGWNPERFPSRSAHNRVRATSQLTAARALWDARSAAEEVVRRVFD